MDKLFDSIDSGFKNIALSGEEVTPLVWNGTNVCVQYLFDLPIPLLKDSILQYDFTTVGGDICFSYTLTTVDQKTMKESKEVILEPCRVSSDSTNTTGTYKAASDSLLTLTFDNSFSWFTSKLLTYSIKLYQPALTVADNMRSTKCQYLLHTIVHDIKVSEKRLLSNQEQIITYRNDIPMLEDTLLRLKKELEIKKATLVEAVSEAVELKSRIALNYEKKNGLFIRCLSKSIMMMVFSYLDCSDVRYVCKYWRLLCDSDDEKKQISIDN